MKRYALVVLAVLSTTMALAGEPQRQETTYKVGIDSQSVDEVAQVLERYVDGPMNVYYEGAVKSAYLQGIGTIIGTLVSLAILVGGLVWLPKTDYTNDLGPVIMVVVGGAGFSLSIAMFLSFGLTCLYAPEYVAIRSILESLPH